MMNRRNFVAGAGALAVLASLAGCSGNGGSAGSAAGSAAGAAAAGAAAAGAVDLLDEIKGRGEMTFATEGTWAPWTYHDESGDLVGYDIEVARGIAERLGVDAAFAEGEWDGLLAGLDSGRYDTMSNGVSVTDEREEKYDFTDAYAYNTTVVITLADNDDIKTLDDLDGKTTANTLGSAYAQLAEAHGAANTGVDDFNQTIQLLEQGRIDATLNDEVVFYDYLSEHPDANLKIACEDDAPTEVAFPLRKDGASELLKAMNDAIADMRASGELSGLSNKYFNMNISEE